MKIKEKNVSSPHAKTGEETRIVMDGAQSGYDDNMDAYGHDEEVKEEEKAPLVSTVGGGGGGGATSEIFRETSDPRPSALQAMETEWGNGDEGGIDAGSRDKEQLQRHSLLHKEPEDGKREGKGKKKGDGGGCIVM